MLSFLPGQRNRVAPAMWFGITATRALIHVILATSQFSLVSSVLTIPVRPVLEHSTCHSLQRAGNHDRLTSGTSDFLAGGNSSICRGPACVERQQEGGLRHCEECNGVTWRRTLPYSKPRARSLDNWLRSLVRSSPGICLASLGRGSQVTNRALPSHTSLSADDYFHITAAGGPLTVIISDKLQSPLPILTQVPPLALALSAGLGKLFRRS